MADLTNNFGAYMQIPTFRFWCQHVIPLVYDDSLSYYEVLCKAISYINNIITDLKTTQDNLGELAEDSEGKFDELETLINSSLTGEYGGMRRKILALTDSAREAMQDERAQHLRVGAVHYEDGAVSYITMRMQGRAVNVRFRESTPESYGLINGVRGYDVSITGLYGTYSEMADSYLEYRLFINGVPATIDDLYEGRLLNTLTIYKRQSENCYIVTNFTPDGVYIFYKYDAAHIPGGGTAWTDNPNIHPVTAGSTYWVDIIRDPALQVTQTANGNLVVISQDETFVANQWHKLLMQW